LIKENKTKKKDLAEAVNLSPSMITDMVKGRGNPSLKTIRIDSGIPRFESWHPCHRKQALTVIP
jgi:transcriptional regulator with XRE-family HTH domain